MRTTRGPGWLLAAVALVGLVGLTGCGGDPTVDAGSDTEDRDDAAAGEDPSGDTPEPEVPVLERAPYCDAIDTAAIAESFGVPAAKVVLLLDRVPGQEYEVLPDEPPETETSWYCNVQSPPDLADGGYVVTRLEEQPSDAEEVGAALDEVRRTTEDNGEEVTCTDEAAPQWGDGGRSLLCARPERDGLPNGGFQDGFTLYTVRGVFGDVDFLCNAGLVTPGDLERARTVGEDVCAGVLADVAD